jgi:hypothetical protein
MVSVPGQSAWHISSALSRPPGALLKGKYEPSQVFTQTSLRPPVGWSSAMIGWPSGMIS